MANWILKLAFVLGKYFQRLLSINPKRDKIVIENFLCSNVGMLVYMSNGLQLEGLSTKKPRTTKFSSKATTVSFSFI